MKIKWESDPLSKPILFELFGLLKLDFSKPLIESIRVVLKEEDIIEHIFSESNESFNRKSIVCFDQVSLEILSLFLTVIVVQSHHGDIKGISNYLKKKCDSHLNKIESPQLYTKIHNTKKKILDEIYLNLESFTIINEHGFNYSILNIYYESIVTQVVLDANIPSQTIKDLLFSYFNDSRNSIEVENLIIQEVKKNYYLHDNFTIILKNKKTDGIEKLLTEMENSCYLNNFFDFVFKKGSGSLILQTILKDTHHISFKQVRKRTLNISNKIKKLFGFDENVFKEMIRKIDTLEETYNNNELFINKAVFSNMLRNNHFMSFILTCDLTIIHERFIFWEYLEALTDGKQLQYLISTLNNQETFTKIEKKVAILASFNIETKLIDSFIFLIKNLNFRT